MRYDAINVCEKVETNRCNEKQRLLLTTSTEDPDHAVLIYPGTCNYSVIVFMSYIASFS